MTDSHRWCSQCRRTYLESQTVPAPDGSLHCPHCSADKIESLVWSAVHSLYGWPAQPVPGAVYDATTP